MFNSVPMQRAALSYKIWETLNYRIIEGNPTELCELEWHPDIGTMSAGGRSGRNCCICFDSDIILFTTALLILSLLGHTLLLFQSQSAFRLHTKCVCGDPTKFSPSGNLKSPALLSWPGWQKAVTSLNVRGFAVEAIKESILVNQPLSSLMNSSNASTK